MKENLEKFFANHRNAFDDEAPAGRVWENIFGMMSGKDKKKRRYLPLLKWSLAAGVMLMVSIGVYFLVEKSKNGKTGAGIVQKDSLRYASVPDAPEVNQFARMIALKQEELKNLGREQPALYREFTSDITQLDSSYKSLKDKLGDSPNREMLIEAMIQNLQLQLNVLNQQLNIINQIKQSKKYSHEKNDQSI